MSSGELLLGRTLDAQEKFICRADHFTTHSLILGATGSGKTGLGLVLIEEALLQGYPVILLDVKGDLTNLWLTFPDLQPEDFLPWVDSEAALRAGRTPAEAAAALAQTWRQGLTDWEIPLEQIRRLRTQVAFALYTPGARNGRPVNILARFSQGAVNDPDDALFRAQGLASALLGLVGIESDPLRSREHILLSQLIQHVWQSGQNLDIAALISLIQRPPFAQIGALDLESFYPAQDRFELASTLNYLLAAPGFAVWQVGDMLDVGKVLTRQSGRTPATLFYLAHLNDEQKQFFVTLLLEEVRSWVRSAPGSSSLRGWVYFDEVYGFLPPHPANPPSKAPLLGLIKQARAAGLGIVLGTQNPADLDYKSLGNIGQWFVGALRTERDRTRVLEGMRGGLEANGLSMERVAETLGALKPRQFMNYNALTAQARFFESRWAMSYLRGPLTLAEVQRLLTGPAPQAAEAPTPATAPTPALPSPSAPWLPNPPVLAPDFPQGFFPPTISASWATHLAQQRGQGVAADLPARLVYRPYLLGLVTLHVSHTPSSTLLVDEQAWRVSLEGMAWASSWEAAELVAARLADLRPTPPAGALFAPLPATLGTRTAFTRLESALKTHIYRTTQISLWSCPPLKLYSRPGESRLTFRERCQSVAQERLQAELQAARQKHEQQRLRLEDKIRRERLELEEETQELSERRREELLSGAETVLRVLSRRSTSRALSQASRQRRYVKKSEAEVTSLRETLAADERLLEQLVADWEAQAQAIQTRWQDMLTQITEITLRPQRTAIEVRFCGLSWFPCWEVAASAGGTLLLPAYAPPDEVEGENRR